MTRFDSKTTEDIIKKVHLLLADIKSGEEIIDYLRSTEPIFMREVGRFVQIELDKLKKDFPEPDDEEFLLYLGSVMGAAYIMGFLIAREVDHKTYNGLLNFDSILSSVKLNMKDVDKLIDSNLEKGKTPKAIGKIIQKYIRGPAPLKRIKTVNKKKKKKDPRINLHFDEKEL